MMAKEVNIKGLEQLVKNIKKLPDELKKKVLQSSTRAAASAIAKQARKECPVGGGMDSAKTKIKTKKKTIHLRDTIRVKKMRGTVGEIRYVVHAGRGLRYAHLVEFGTAPHKIKARSAMTPNGVRFFKSANHPGARANPFMRRAFAKAQSKALDRFKKIGMRRFEKLRLKQ